MRVKVRKTRRVFATRRVLCECAIYILNSDDVHIYESNIEIWSCSEMEFSCLIPMITLEKYVSRSYEVYCLRKMIMESRRLPNKKVLQFDNIWFVMDTSPWSLLEMVNITAKEMQVLMS